MKTLRNFWPLDFDEEGEIYDNPAWNMPGLKRTTVRRPKAAGKATARSGRGPLS